MKWGGNVTYEERHNFLLENGICTTCGKAPAAKGHTSCLSCLDNFGVIYEGRRERMQKYYREHAEKINEVKRRRYAERKAQGLCIACARPAVEGTIYCETCRRKKNERARRRNHDRKCGGQGC